MTEFLIEVGVKLFSQIYFLLELCPFYVGGVTKGGTRINIFIHYRHHRWFNIWNKLIKVFGFFFFRGLKKSFIAMFNTIWGLRARLQRTKKSISPSQDVPDSTSFFDIVLLFNRKEKFFIIGKMLLALSKWVLKWSLSFFFQISRDAEN